MTNPTEKLFSKKELQAFGEICAITREKEILDKIKEIRYRPEYLSLVTDNFISDFIDEIKGEKK